MAESTSLPKRLGITGLGEHADVRYEVRDESGARRLRDLLEQFSHSNDELPPDPKPIFSVTTEKDSPTERFRFRSEEDIETYHVFNLPLQTVRSPHTSQKQTGSFEVMIRSEGNPILSNSQSEVEIYPSDFSTESGGIDYNPVREFRVAGLADEREQVREFLEATDRRWGIAPEHGMLLAGPPGTGKTEVVMEVCRELYGAVPVTISGPEILSRWVGESERLLRDKFERAREGDAGVLYIDEIDAIARARSQTTQDYSAQIVAQLLVLLDGIESKQAGRSLKVIASTNMAELVDPALRRPGRLGRTQRFEALEGDDALAVLHHYLEQIHLHASDEETELTVENDLSEEIEKFVRDGNVETLDTDPRHDIRSHLNGRTGAEIEQVVQEATRQADTNGAALQAEHLYPQQTVVPEDDGSAQLVRPPQENERQSASNPFNQSLGLCIRLSSSAESTPKQVARTAFEQYLAQREVETGEFREIDLTEELVQGELTHIERFIWSRVTADSNRPVCVFIHNAERIAEAADYSQVANAVLEVLYNRLLSLRGEPEETASVLLAFEGSIDAMPFPAELLTQV